MLVEERSAAIQMPQAPSGTALVRGRPHAGPLVLVAACLALAGVSLLLPSAPTYDPWSWIIWGREIAHLDLVTTLGPSWKPLPVLFTTVFSFFGPAAPALWLVVARAGALAAVFFAYRVARRLGGGIVGGVAAAAALAIAPWWIRNAALGNSEGLIVAFVLAAVDRELAGRRDVAFAMAVCAGLLRPEAWPFLAAYSVFLMWRRALPVRVVLGAGIVVLALWLLPEWWGSGDLWRAAHRAKNVNPGAPTFADNPALQTLHNAGGMLTAPLHVGLAAAAVMLVVARHRVVAALVVISIAWLGLVAYMTEDGFSGNQRYLMAPMALLMVLSGSGAGWLLGHIAERVRAGVTRPGAGGPAGVAVAAVAVGLAFMVPSFGRFVPNLHAIKYQADLANELPGLVAAAGGAEALKRCGDPYTGPFMVPVVAWNLHVHTMEVQVDPVPPAVVFRERTTAGARLVPSVRGVANRRKLAAGARWRIVAQCGSGAG